MDNGLPRPNSVPDWNKLPGIYYDETRAKGAFCNTSSFHVSGALVQEQINT